MQFIKPDINIDFVGKRKIAFVGSLILIAISIISLVIKGGPRYGIDFAGGTLVQVKFSREIEPGTIKNALRSLRIGITAVQGFGEKKEYEFLIRAAQWTAVMPIRSDLRAFWIVPGSISLENLNPELSRTP